jgi:RNA:NAD 2'-phosphotransferase (TPT1/KptA family)
MSQSSSSKSEPKLDAVGQESVMDVMPHNVMIPQFTRESPSSSEKPTPTTSPLKKQPLNISLSSIAQIASIEMPKNVYGTSMSQQASIGTSLHDSSEMDTSQISQASAAFKKLSEIASGRRSKSEASSSSFQAADVSKDVESSELPQGSPKQQIESGLSNLFREFSHALKDIGRRFASMFQIQVDGGGFYRIGSIINLGGDPNIYKVLCEMERYFSEIHDSPFINQKPKTDQQSQIAEAVCKIISDVAFKTKEGVCKKPGLISILKTIQSVVNKHIASEIDIRRWIKIIVEENGKGRFRYREGTENSNNVNDIEIGLVQGHTIHFARHYNLNNRLLYGRPIDEKMLKDDLTLGTTLIHATDSTAIAKIINAHYLHPLTRKDTHFSIDTEKHTYRSEKEILCKISIRDLISSDINPLYKRVLYKAANKVILCTGDDDNDDGTVHVKLISLERKRGSSDTSEDIEIQKFTKQIAEVDIRNSQTMRDRIINSRKIVMQHLDLYKIFDDFIDTFHGQHAVQVHEICNAIYTEYLLKKQIMEAAQIPAEDIMRDEVTTPLPFPSSPSGTPHPGTPTLSKHMSYQTASSSSGFRTVSPMKAIGANIAMQGQLTSVEAKVQALASKVEKFDVMEKSISELSSEVKALSAEMSNNAKSLSEQVAQNSAALAQFMAFMQSHGK